MMPFRVTCLGPLTEPRPAMKMLSQSLFLPIMVECANLNLSSPDDLPSDGCNPDELPSDGC